MAGYFFSLDGIDGTGKSTQVQMLADWLRLRGRSVDTCRDPGGTPLGQQVRAVLLEQHLEMSPMAEALLFMASRAELVHRVIRPRLAAGGDVVCDRFLLANVVYQGYGGGLDVEQLWQIGGIATGGLTPHLTVVLDLPIAAAQARRSRDPDRMERRESDFHERVRAGFLQEQRKLPDKIVVVDAEGSIDAVHQRICGEVERVLGAHSRA